MFNTSFENSKRALFREQKEDKHPTFLKFTNFEKHSPEHFLRKIPKYVCLVFHLFVLFFETSRLRSQKNVLESDSQIS